MTAKGLNQQLQDVYEAYVGELYGKEWADDVSAPLLMHVFDDYIDMDKKIMFVGQETHGWGEMTKKPSVKVLQKMYEDFDLGKHADYGDGKKPRYLRSPFWNFNRSIFHRVNAVDRKKSGFLWTNISKFDQKQTTPPQELQSLNYSGFRLLEEEISICEPDVVIFLTGEKYDERIKSMFQVADNKIEEDVPLWKVDMTEPNSLSLMLKTEHPRTLCQNEKYRGKRMYHKVIEMIVDQCNKANP